MSPTPKTPLLAHRYNRTPETFRKLVLVHGACVLTQLFFGGGSVVGKFGVKGSNPVLFALVREGVAGPLLCLAAYFLEGDALSWRNWAHVRLVLACGFCLFANQLAFIVGLKISNAITASAWQPSQPVFTAGLAILLGWEVATWRKLAGIACASGGAVFMAVYGATHGQPGAAAGSVLFAINCLGTSCYILASKPLLASYRAISVTGWSYICCSFMMAVAAAVVNGVPSLTAFVCHDEDAAAVAACVGAKWGVNPGMAWPLAYWILFSSCGAYALMTWANIYVDGSIVSAYTAIQPATSALISVLLIAARGRAFGKKYGLTEPGLNDLGALAIFLGLGLVLSDKSARRTQRPRGEGEGGAPLLVGDLGVEGGRIEDDDDEEDDEGGGGGGLTNYASDGIGGGGGGDDEGTKLL